MNIAEEMAKEFKRLEALEYKSGKSGDAETAHYYMSRKWEAQEAAKEKGVLKEFFQELDKIEIEAEQELIAKAERDNWEIANGFKEE